MTKKRGAKPKDETEKTENEGPFILIRFNPEDRTQHSINYSGEINHAMVLSASTTLRITAEQAIIDRLRERQMQEAANKAQLAALMQDAMKVR